MSEFEEALKTLAIEQRWDKLSDNELCSLLRALLDYYKLRLINESLIT